MDVLQLFQLYLKISIEVIIVIQNIWSELYIYVTGPAKIDHLSTKNCWYFLYLLHYNLITIYTNTIPTTAEFNGLSSAIYRNRILHSELKILAKIQLGVICTHMVDFHTPGHVYSFHSLPSLWDMTMVTTVTYINSYGYSL